MIRMVRWDSDGEREIVECLAEPVPAGDFGSDVVVVAAEVLGEGMSGGQDPRCAFRDLSAGARFGGEAGEVLIAGEFPEAAGDEPAGGSGVPALACQASLEERAVGTAQGAVAGETVETVFRVGASQPLQQQAVPFR